MTTVPRHEVDRIIADYEHDVARFRARVRSLVRAVWPWVKDAAFIIGCVGVVWVVAWVFA